MKAQNQSVRSLYGATAIAAIIGGVVLDLKIALEPVIQGHPAPIPGMWQFIASTLVGQVAFTSVAYAALGLVMHFATALFWSFAYLFVWSRISSLKNWIVGGIVWGLVTMLGMGIFLHFKIGIPWPAFTWNQLDSAIGHTVFFMLPVAWYIARSARAR